MVLIHTCLGQVAITKETRQHFKRNGHRLLSASEIKSAINSVYFRTQTQSAWKGKPAINHILLGKLSDQDILIVLKEATSRLLVITAYQPRPNQVRKLISGTVKKKLTL